MTWHAACNNGSCVEVAYDDGWVGVRDGKRGDGPVLVYSGPEWISFIDAAKAGRFDLDRIAAGGPRGDHHGPRNDDRDHRDGP
ncbi:DUF397 domain-containing protein [Sphaerisporangium rufum]|uniref:DUF397 domain-containing protein n=1 Tax=Sphaerisporangium rufum TaxID=1381558 RepID=UPI001EF1F43E|nr:DUF397 domain-containing protein [Sphaerisporangium rufum]